MPSQTLKQKVQREFVDYLWVSLYLMLFLSAFAAYRRLVVAEYGGTLPYGSAVIEALILGKVVLIGQALKLGEGAQGKPLIWPTLRKSFAFSVLVFLFAILEAAVKRLIRHEDFLPAFTTITPGARNEALARAIIIFVAFIPFFAFQALSLHYGTDSLTRLFFQDAKKHDIPPNGG